MAVDVETDRQETEESGKQTVLHPEKKYGHGVLAGLEFSKEKYYYGGKDQKDLTEQEINAFKTLVMKAAKRDYPARLIEVIQTWEAALFYRGFQFLIPQRGGGWIVPGESTGYGPTMQMDLALLPTNIYSARAQMLIAALTRSVPTTRFGPAQANSDASITAADSAQKFLRVIARNNDFIAIQTDGARYLWTDGRYIYWSRFEKDGQRFGWEEDDEPDDIVPENEGEALASEAAEPNAENPESAPAEAQPAEEQQEQVQTEEDLGAPEERRPEDRKPRGQEVRTAHGKLETKMVPMMANSLEECDAVQLEWEHDTSRVKAMFPWICDDVKPGSLNSSEGEIAKLARQNVKLGMQSTYVTSDSIAEDVTVQRTWMRPSWFLHAPEEVRDGLIEKFPDGCLCVYAGEVFAYAQNQSMDHALALCQAYSGDGQNRNALGTSTLPIQKRVNNWLDLLNDYLVRAVPKKWMDNKAFNVEAIRQQTNVPGDVGAFKGIPGKSVGDLIFCEPEVPQPASLVEIIQQYTGPLAELLSGGYPALAGGDVGTADSGVAIATQRDSALGRLAPTWHQIKQCEATSSKQLVRWGAKCRDKSINEKIPGGEVITLEINDLQGNILAFAESDENFPETYTQKKNGMMTLVQDSAKNPQLMEVFFNSANLEFMQRMWGISELYVPKVTSRNKQLGEIELLLKTTPVPNPAYEKAKERLALMKENLEANGQPLELLDPAVQQLGSIPDELPSIQIDEKTDDNATEAETCWQYLNGEDGRRDKTLKPKGYENVKLHYLDHKQAAMQEAAAAQQNAQKPPSKSINYKDVAMIDKAASDQLLQAGGMTPTPPEKPPAGPTPGIPEKQPAQPIPVAPPHAVGAHVS